jgi:hypothetical protein
MTQVSRRTFLEIASLASAGLLGGCGGGSGGNVIIEPGDFSVPVFSDVHFQPFIDPYLPDKATLNPATTAANKALAAQLDAAGASQWPAILAGANSPPSACLTDTNYTLLGLALNSIEQNLGTSPAVLFTGDFLGHGMTVLYLAYTANKTLADAEAFIDKTLTFVLQQIRTALGTTPVYFTLGNCDSYSDEGPESSFLTKNAQQLYTLALNGVGNEQDVINTITNGGYYSVEPAGLNLMIIALNTFALSPGYAVITTLIDDQFAWLDARLADASMAGKKIWLLMHAPPGAVEDTTAESSNDINGQITTATMMWTDSNQEQFMGIIEKYPGVIAMSLAGHTHMDEFRLMSPGVALEITAGISPYFGNNPAYKIFTLDSVSLAPFDYSAVNCNLSITPAAFNSYYTFSQAYKLEGLLATSLPELFPTLLASNTAKMQYQGAFYSGNNGLNPINSTNWPVYWCGIGYVDEQEFFAAVNAF